MCHRWPEKETRKALVNMAKTAWLLVLMLVNRQNCSKGDETVGRSLLVSMKYIHTVHPAVLYFQVAWPRKGWTASWNSAEPSPASSLVQYLMYSVVRVKKEVKKER
jgi:hypothetical protein